MNDLSCMAGRKAAPKNRGFQVIAVSVLSLLVSVSPLTALPLSDEAVAEQKGSLIDTDLKDAPLMLAQAELTPEELLKRKKQRGKGKAASQQKAEPQEPEPAPQQQAEPQEPESAPQQQAEPQEPEPAPQQEAEPQEPEPAPQQEAEPQELESAPQQEAEPQEPEPAPQQEAEPQEPESAPQQEAEPQEPEPALQQAEPQEPESAPQQEAEPQEPEPAPQQEAEPQEPEPAPQQEAEPQEPEPAPQQEAEPQEPEPAPQQQAEPQEPESAPQQEAQPQEPTETGDDRELSDDATPVLDSAKEERRRTQRQQPDRQATPAEAPPAPESDAAAQAGFQIDRSAVEALISQEGRRIEEPRPLRDTVPEGAQIVREVNNRTIIQFNNTYIVERQRDERLSDGAREVYYEELPQDLQREVVIRPDGTRIITDYNRYGDVVRRVKVLPDDREVVLVYVEDRYHDEGLEWRDPGADLPPLLLTIPPEEYILDAALVEDPDAYYTFLEQPPVEAVERTYSLDEVRRSARIRDKVRRIDLDVINFAFGSAEIGESEIDKLQAVADAMLRLLKENPGEVFFIEGHTDAVGSDLANLALSDQRAEAVAIALTNVFDIPPENLEVQGYGEEYLKINTQQRERENRRVAIRRITPLVAPVARAQ